MTACPRPSLARHLLAACCLLVGCTLGASESHTVISDGATPRVSFRLSSEGEPLQLELRVQSLESGFPRPSLRLGIAAERTAFFNEGQASIREEEDAWVYVFSFAQARPDASGEVRWRWALDIDWPNAEGQSALRQNFFVPGFWPAFAGIGQEPSHWEAFSLLDYRKAQAMRDLRLKFPFEQPMDGIASVVIEDAEGRRVRNLLMGQELTRGGHELRWDGLDENGNLVTPATYYWRAISHPGIEPELLMWFYNPGGSPWTKEPSSAWLGDHSNPVAAASNGTFLAFGSPVAESGHNLVVVDENGQKRSHADISWFVGRGDLFLALGPDRLYALSEGSPNYNHTLKDEDGHKYVLGELVLLRWDLDGKRLSYPGKQGEARLREYRKPAEEVTRYKKGFAIGNIRGVVWLDGKLFVSLRHENQIAVIDPDKGVQTGSIELPSPGPIATDGQLLYVLSTAGQLTRIRQPGGEAVLETLFSIPLSEPLPSKDENGEPWPVATALAIGPQNQITVADNGVDQNIKIYSLDHGQKIRELGPKGGRAPRGPWQPNSFSMPYGLAFDGRGMLWVVENEGTPRRVSVWDTTSGLCVTEYLGPTSYGAPGAGFDPQNPRRWIGAGLLWDVDLEKAEARPQAVLHHQVAPGQLAGPPPGGTSDVPEGLDIQIVHYDDRSFFFTKGRFLRVFELLPDGSARLWAVLGTLESFQATTPRWAVPEAFTRHPALKQELASFTEITGPFDDLRNAPKPSAKSRDYLILWTDVNGDEIAQTEELQVMNDSRKLVVPYWSALNFSLDLVFAMQEGNHWFRTRLPLHGFLASGAPDWVLSDSLSEAVPFEGYVPSNLQATMVDSQQRLLLNASPMAAIGEKGQLLWQMRNDWNGVHGSHRAPLPQPGLLQGSLSFLGRAPLDKEGDLTVLNGNHGRFFILSTDGIYVDEIFEDVRVALTNNPQRIGGEPFGGFFGYDPDSGHYLLQSGHRAFQIYQLRNLNALERSSGQFTVSPAQITAAQKLFEAQQKPVGILGSASLLTVGADANLSTPPEDWPGDWTAEWGDARRDFPYARVKARIQGNRLHLGFEVKDPSPWLNHGTDQLLLFKSGDAVDFQFAIDQTASASRLEPVAGDRRLLMASFQGKPVAMLYDYVVPGTREPLSFNSPWRSAKVDRVIELKEADIVVRPQGKGYTVTASVPLAGLGLSNLDPSLPLRADFGVIYSDQEGRSNALRSYWSNPATGLVNDTPGETLINPSLWGNLKLER